MWMRRTVRQNLFDHSSCQFASGLILLLHDVYLRTYANVSPTCTVKHHSTCSFILTATWDSLWIGEAPVRPLLRRRQVRCNLDRLYYKYKRDIQPPNTTPTHSFILLSSLSTSQFHRTFTATASTIAVENPLRYYKTLALTRVFSLLALDFTHQILLKLPNSHDNSSVKLTAIGWLYCAQLSVS